MPNKPRRAWNPQPTQIPERFETHPQTRSWASCDLHSETMFTALWCRQGISEYFLTRAFVWESRRGSECPRPGRIRAVWWGKRCRRRWTKGRRSYWISARIILPSWLATRVPPRQQCNTGRRYYHQHRLFEPDHCSPHCIIRTSKIAVDNIIASRSKVIGSAPVHACEKRLHTKNLSNRSWIQYHSVQ